MNTQHNNVPRLAPLTVYPFKHFKGTLYLEGTFTEDELQTSVAALDWAVNAARGLGLPDPAGGFALIRAGADHPFLYRKEDVELACQKTGGDVARALVLLNVLEQARDKALRTIALGGAHERRN